MDAPMNKKNLSSLMLVEKGVVVIVVISRVLPGRRAAISVYAFCKATFIFFPTFGR